MAESVPPDGPVDGSRAVKVGVLLAQIPEEVGQWLADASAFDAAGADALWLETGPEPELDVLTLTAALSVVTFRSLLVVAVRDLVDPPGGLARRLATVARLSGGRLALIAEPGRREEVAVLAPGVGIFGRVPGQPGTFAGTGGGDELERWVSTSFPQSRAAWRDARVDAAERGVGGLLVPADPRLLDILRNPEDPGDRRDLRLAQG